MLRVGRLTDYATILLAALARGDDRHASAVALAEATRIELPTVSKVLKQLAKAELVHSLRGVRGGYRLARAPATISVADIVAAMEGPIGMTDCSVHGDDCGHSAYCSVKVNWRTINRAIEAALASVTLADMVAQPAVPARHPLIPSVTVGG